MKFIIPTLLLLITRASSQFGVQNFESNGLNTALTSHSVLATNFNGLNYRTNSLYTSESINELE